MEFKEKLMQYKPYFIVVIIILGLISFNIYTLTLASDEETEDVIPIATKEKKVSKIKVDIKGFINNPGVYELESNDRVIDLIEKAGGLSKNADTSIINLSKKLEDEMVVIIYSKVEVNRLKQEEKDVCPKSNDACVSKKLEVITENKSLEKNETSEKININTALLEQIQSLNGIGESKARAIIKYRDEHGNFKKLEDIKNVSGIGDAAYEKIKDKITI